MNDKKLLRYVTNVTHLDSYRTRLKFGENPTELCDDGGLFSGSRLVVFYVSR